MAGAGNSDMLQLNDGIVWQAAGDAWAKLTFSSATAPYAGGDSGRYHKHDAYLGGAVSSGADYARWHSAGQRRE